MSVIVVIPARMQSTRLPGKPLLDLGGEPMILRVWRRACLATSPARVIVATDHERIIELIHGAGGDAVMTRSDHASGSDRVWEAAEPIPCDVVVNVQGDEPFLEPALVDRVAAAAQLPGVEVATAAAPLEGPHAPASVVRVAVGPGGEALAFARRDLPGQRCLHHLGIYAYRKGVLGAFTRLEPSPGELSSRLEQLRLLDNGYSLAVVEVDEVPLSVDTPEDLLAARRRLAVRGPT